MSRTRGPWRAPRKVADDRVAEAPARIRSEVDVRPQIGEERRDPAPDLVHAIGRVRPAVDADQVGEVVEVVGQLVGDRRAQRLELSIGGRLGGHRDGQSTRRPCCYPAGTVRLVEIRLFEGPNVYRLEPVVKLEVAVGRRRTWYGQRDPGRTPSSTSGPTSRPGTGRTRSRRSRRGSAACGRTMGRGGRDWQSTAPPIPGTGSSPSPGRARNGPGRWRRRRSPWPSATSRPRRRPG